MLTSTNLRQTLSPIINVGLHLVYVSVIACISVGLEAPAKCWPTRREPSAALAGGKVAP